VYDVYKANVFFNYYKKTLKLKRADEVVEIS